MSMTSVDDSVQKLSDLARELNSLTNILNRKIEQIENQLVAAGVGIEHWLVGRPFRTAAPNAEEMVVGWARGDAGEFEFRVGFLQSKDSKAIVGPRSLLATARAIRIASFPLLDVLVRELTDRIMSALREFDRIRDRLDDPGAPGGESSDDDLPF
jgi:hypothetical protein